MMEAPTYESMCGICGKHSCSHRPGDVQRATAEEQTEEWELLEMPGFRRCVFCDKSYSRDMVYKGLGVFDHVWQPACDCERTAKMARDPLWLRAMRWLVA